jgi:alanine racemase
MKSWIEISRANLGHNLRAVQTLAGPAVETLAVIKADGYGHDATLVAQVLAEAGAPWLGVTDADEGVRVRSAVGWSKPRILVMCGSEPADAPSLIEYKLTPVVWTLEHLHTLEQAAQGTAERFAVHLEVDTGMSRQGVAPGPDLDAMLRHFASSPTLFCEGVMTHLACAEASDGTRGASVTERQGDQFHQALKQVKAAGIKPAYLHMGNTSALDEGSTMPWIRAVAASFGAHAMVRTGLALYGDALPLEGNASAALHPHLKPVLTWKTRILGLREIQAGTTVGYGATFTAPHPMRLALLAVGYADGFRREASSGVGNGWVVIAGQRAVVVGRISMNLLVVDVTHIAVTLQDDATLLGEGVSADDHARWCGTIPYEILCGIRAQGRLI